MTSLKLHNTLTNKLDEFLPITPGEVLLYTCGPTVYDYPHIGNWTAYVYWDILVRLLEHSGYNVKRVMNITDVGHLVSDADDGEDKLEKGAKREGKTAWEVAEFYTNVFMQGMDKLGLVKPQYITKATDYILEQMNLVRTLQAKGVTYNTSDGIYFDTSKFSTYANFAHLDLESQKAGARVEYNPEKHNPSDFALWKFTPNGEKRDMQWEFDGRMGFPGWHLECSAMAMAILGETIDIHTGGIDHIPVHHTNEIAQSETATGKRFSNYWLHNNFLKVDGKKFSKSLGNGYTLEDLEKKGYSAMDFRMFLLQGHYSSESNFTFENLTAAKNRLHNWRNVAALRHQMHDTVSSDQDRELAEKTLDLSNIIEEIMQSLNNDLNTPEVLKVVDEAFSKIQSNPLSRIPHHAFLHLLETIDQLLGLNLLTDTPDISDDAKRLILERNIAREQKDWKKSDQLREDLQNQGIIIRDSLDSSIWEYTS